jgi:undecaprenyl phosphate N,N'-diacetylbacillosamine 1-phosphate transferase
VVEVMKNSHGGTYRRFMKRPMDFILSLIAITILTIIPVLPIVAILVKTKLGSPVLFKQKRPGLNEDIFMMYKFRTMTDKKDETGDLLPDNERLTKFGKFLRSTSLDELPELFNILKGDMSFIGPRPLLLRYLPYYREEERLRSKVRPGITGLAQVNGRNALTWNERFKTDVEYVKSLSLLVDMKILINTILVVFQRKDILVGSEHIMKDLDVERREEFNYGLREQRDRSKVN